MEKSRPDTPPPAPSVSDGKCSDSHGIDTERWTVDPHPRSACAELIEMGKGPSPSFLEAILSE